MASHIAEQTKRPTRKTRSVVVWSLGLLAMVLAAAITFTVGWRPFLGPRARPLTTVRFAPTPERKVRGTYLVEHVTPCMDCHAPHRWAEHDAPVLPNMVGAGQEIPMKGLPGRVVAPNISPDPDTGMGTWTDDQLARAIREGIGHDGRALFPIMPYQRFRSMSDEDLASIIVYLRALPPVRQPQPPTELIVPVRYLIRSLPEPLHAPVPAPDVSTPVKRGAYLTTIAACAECHTPQDDRGQPLKGLDFAGGFIFDGPWGRVASANLTPDPSGIPYYDAALLTEVLRTGHQRPERAADVVPALRAHAWLRRPELTTAFTPLARSIHQMERVRSVGSSDPTTRPGLKTRPYGCVGDYAVLIAGAWCSVSPPAKSASCLRRMSRPRCRRDFNV